MIAAPILGNPALEEGTDYQPGIYGQHKKNTLPSIGYIIAEELPAGIGHILTGLDHILFVIALGLIFSRAWNLVKVVTWFTIAHALTLTLASLDIIPIGKLGVAIIEFGVALSIAWVGIENILIQRKDINIEATNSSVRRRSLIAFAFGLVHGLAFSEHFRSSLLNIELSGANLGKFLLKILFFNLGVDLGQLIFAFGSFGLLWLVLHKTNQNIAKDVHKKLVFYGSLLVAIFGLIWSVERIINVSGYF